MANLLLHDPDLLQIVIEEYFLVRENEKSPPTVPSLALAIGFFRTYDIVKSLKDWEEGHSQYNDGAIKYLLGALTRIEDYTLVNGMKSLIPAALVKFTLGAYHDVKEPEREGAPDISALQIIFEAPQDTGAAKIAAGTLQNKVLQPGQKKIESGMTIEMEV